MGDTLYEPPSSEPLQKSMSREGYVRLTGSGSNGLIKISMPDISREQADQSGSFPKEKCKTLVMLFWLLSGFMSTTIAISFVHEYVPDRKGNPPLPDVFFSHIDRQKWAFKCAEVIGISTLGFYWTMIFFHQHRKYEFLRSVFPILIKMAAKIV